jgi:hypothetical protein
MFIPSSEVVMSLAPSPVRESSPVGSRARRLAVAAAVVWAAEAVVAALFPANLADHSTGAGQVSEALAGLGFLLVAATLVVLVPALTRVGRWLAALAVLGCAAVGIAQLDIAARGQEWAESVVTLIVLIAWAGLLLAGIAGAMARVWPWWAVVLPTLVVPALFFVPSPANSAVIAALWGALGAVTLSGRRRP